MSVRGRLGPKDLMLMFWAFFKIGSFTLGGGFAMIPMMKVEMVDKQGWVSEEDFLDIIAITQSAPGAVAINSSIYIGYKLAGHFGSFLATLGTVLPSFLVILLISSFYVGIKSNIFVEKAFKGIYPAIVVLILAAAFNLRKAAFKTKTGLITALVALVALVIYDLHPVIIVSISGLLGVFLRKSDLFKKRSS